MLSRQNALHVPSAHGVCDLQEMEVEIGVVPGHTDGRSHQEFESNDLSTSFATEHLHP